MSNIYEDNVATYGDNYASYPYKLKVINDNITFLTNVVSGHSLSEDIIVGIFD
jgi:hypothetical protein